MTINAKNAGYTITDYVSKPFEGDTIEGVVIGRKMTIYGEQFVTWHFTQHPAEEPSYFWGHYFGDIKNAKRDYHERAVKLFAE